MSDEHLAQFIENNQNAGLLLNYKKHENNFVNRIV